MEAEQFLNSSSQSSAEDFLGKTQSAQDFLMKPSVGKQAKKLAWEAIGPYVGIGEAVLNLAGQAVTLPATLLGGAAKTITSGKEAGMKTMEEMSKALTWQPRTEEGQAALTAINEYFMQPVFGRPLEEVEKFVTKLSGSEKAGALANIGAQAALLKVGAGAREKPMPVKRLAEIEGEFKPTLSDRVTARRREVADIKERGEAELRKEPTLIEGEPRDAIDFLKPTERLEPFEERTYGTKTTETREVTGEPTLPLEEVSADRFLTEKPETTTTMPVEYYQAGAKKELLDREYKAPDIDATAFLEGQRGSFSRRSTRPQPDFTNVSVADRQAVEQVARMYKITRDTFDTRAKVAWSKVRDVFTRAITDVSGNAKRSLVRQAGDLGKQAVIDRDLIAGASGKAGQLIEQAHDSIYGGLSQRNIDLLNEYINSRRTITVDSYKPDMKHPGGLTGVEHQKYLDNFAYQT